MPLQLKYKRWYKALLFFFALLVLALLIYAYTLIQSDVSIIEQAVSMLQQGASSILNSLSHISSTLLTETIGVVIFFASAIIVINYLLNWYYLEKRNALIDELTELYNRKAMTLWLKKETDRAKRFNHPLSVAMIDLDRFKIYNDTNGHLRGDWLLKAISKVFKENTRDIDFVGRYGGEEFIIVFPETGHENALQVCERIRKLIETSKFPGEEKIPTQNMTISIGLVTFCDNYDEERMIKLADEFLYQAKAQGRNRIVHKNVCEKK
jgi:diguanylate cyclase (GGDEF)-like protein